jgi:hypothetical protein
VHLATAAARHDREQQGGERLLDLLAHDVTSVDLSLASVHLPGEADVHLAGEADVHLSSLSLHVVLQGL